jgi:hypothetical protein
MREHTGRPRTPRCAARGPSFGRRFILLPLALLAALTVVATSFAEVVQQGTLRVSISTQVKPYRLPRTDPAPIKVLIAGHVWTSTGAVPPQLRRMTVLINKHGELRPGAIPSCKVSQIRPATSAQAIERCGSALVGSGHFWASVVLPEQGVYHTTGRLLAFNGVIAGKPAFLAQIYTTQPFPTSFVVTFAVRKISQAPWGTELQGSLPSALGNWGFVDRIKLNLGRTFHLAGGAEKGYLEAGCPAPKGTDTVVFPLAKADLDFADGEALSTTISKPCGVTKE